MLIEAGVFVLEEDPAQKQGQPGAPCSSATGAVPAAAGTQGSTAPGSPSAAAPPSGTPGVGRQQAANGLLLSGGAPVQQHPGSSGGTCVQSVPVSQPGGLRVLNWNCFKLNPSRQLDLEILLQKYSPDIAVVTEVDRESDDVSQMSFPGYTCTAPPAANNKVRVLALTRDDIKIKAGPMLADLPVVTLVLPDHKLSVVGIYRQHHGGAHDPQVADLDSIREIVSSLSNSSDICLAGDINLDAGKYGSVPSSKRELYESWLELTSTNGLDLLQTGPTFKSFGKFRGGHHQHPGSSLRF